MQVHSEKPRDDHQRHCHGAVNRQDFHYLVGAIGHGREVDIEGSCEQIAVGFYQIHSAYQVVVHVAKIGVEIVTREATLAANDGVHHVAHARGSAPNIDQAAFELKNLA